MTDCPNVEMREQLPDLLHGTLSLQARERVQVHIDGCTDCARELAILRSVIATATATVPRVDVARIVTVIPPYQHQQHQQHQHQQQSGGSSAALSLRRPWFRAMPVRLAAAFVIAAVGISAVVMTRDGDVSEARQPTLGDVHVAQPTSSTEAPEGLMLVAVNSLSDTQIEQLIAGMDSLDALPSADPEPVSMASFGGGM